MLYRSFIVTSDPSPVEAIDGAVDGRAQNSRAASNQFLDDERAVSDGETKGFLHMPQQFTRNRRSMSLNHLPRDPLALIVNPQPRLGNVSVGLGKMTEMHVLGHEPE